MRFSVTIDTEADKSRDWSVSRPMGWRGIFEGVAEILQPLFEREEVRPVYFLSPEVILNGETAAVFRGFAEEDRAELATHLHFEFIEPTRVPDPDGRKFSGVQCQLSEADERDAMTNLTEAFYAAFGYRPVSFRAGRFGIGRNTGIILHDLGYRADSSVTPGIRWDFSEEGPGLENDSRRAPLNPYRVDPRDLWTPNPGGVLWQIPVTNGPAPLTPREIARRMIGRPPRRVWLRPGFGSDAETARLIGEAATGADDATLLVIMFHNMEVIPGKSPYTHDRAGAERHIAQIAHLIRTAKDFGFRPATIADYVESRS